MKKYIGTKLIDAEPMTKGEYNTLKGINTPITENKDEEGYKIKYSDDYISWCPKEIFDKSHLLLRDEEGNRILQKDVDNFIKFCSASKIGNKTAALHLELNNEFEMLESSSCVLPENFDLDIGAAQAMEKAKERIWGYLGFLLQCAKKGFKN